jgi:hypothetical protein
MSQELILISASIHSEKYTLTCMNNLTAAKMLKGELSMFFLVCVSNLRQNRVVIAHFRAFTSLNKMAAAVILKLGRHVSGFMNF